MQLEGVEKLFPKAHSLLVRYYGMDYDDAEDIIQDTVLRLLQEDDPPFGMLPNYFFRRMYQTLVDHVRKINSKKRGGSGITGDKVEKIVLVEYLDTMSVPTFYDRRYVEHTVIMREFFSLLPKWQQDCIRDGRLENARCFVRAYDNAKVRGRQLSMQYKK